MRYNDINQLRKIDLNLLLNLQVLLQEKHVSNAADVLCISQPAVSKNLKKLRDIFADQLLIRVKNHLELTPKAIALKKELNPLVQSLSHFFSEQEVNLAKVEKDVVIMASDYASPIWLNNLIFSLQEQAPNISITIKSWNEQNIRNFSRGEIDFALGVLANASSSVSNQLIGSVQLGLIVKIDHPLTTLPTIKKIDLIQYPLVKIKGGQQFDTIFQQSFEQNFVLLSQASLWLALSVVKKTQACLIASKDLFEQISGSSLAFIPLPQLQPISISISWPKRLQDDIVHKWLRSKICEIGAISANTQD